MNKVLCILAMAISVILLLVFLLDAAAGIPFNRSSVLLDIVFIVCAGAVGTLSFFSFRQFQ